MKRIILILSVLITLGLNDAHSQDTFSIVAVDAETGEVGSAGASCVDLQQMDAESDDFLAHLIPNKGVIITQAYYLPTNQNNATKRMQAGDTPRQIIQWLIANDSESNPSVRQYAVAAIINGKAETAAYTGESTDEYKNHIIGSNYAVQGNILLGEKVLLAMQRQFENTSGDLRCKLMAAMQGANIIGADTRCKINGTSSLFAFLKVAKPNDEMGQPSFLISARTAENAGKEPINLLQNEFNRLHHCD